MTRYIITILGRDYNNYIIKNLGGKEIEQNIVFNPLEQKLFDKDVFSYDNNKLNIIKSPIINNNNIPGVLILENNKTYGRNVIPGKKYTLKNQAKMFYKCVPDDPNIPEFLVPYEIKTLGFSKIQSNLYVTIQFTKWEDKHPFGVISQIIGSVDILDNFYEYQLYCKDLNHSITEFNKTTTHNVKTIVHDNYNKFIDFVCLKYKNSFQDRTNADVFSIDPQSSKDFDDAFSISKLYNNQIILSIYIANVSIWLDVLQLWSEFSKRVSTIYLPDKKRPMLPNILSDNLCSLKANELRFAFTMDVIIEDDTIIDIKYVNTLIKVKRNYVYEEPDLLGNSNYKLLLGVTSLISQKYNFLNSIINDSHELVAYLMILMNYQSATRLLKFNKGIFRSTTTNASTPVLELRKWLYNSSGIYVNIDNFGRHNILDLDAYTHITSPIRRIVDLLNIIQLQECLNLITLSPDAILFLNNWSNKIEYINSNMKSIKKVQNDCNLLDFVSNKTQMVDKSYEGYCFDKTQKPDGLYKYTVFLPELKFTANIILSNDFENYEKKLFKLFIFNNENKFKKKVRLSLM
jgi:exoribonuclease R